MNIELINNHKYIKLIEFAMKNKNFSIIQASEECCISSYEFEQIWRSIFVVTAELEDKLHPSMSYSWLLKPEAIFSYMSFLEYKDSVSLALKANKTATYSLWAATGSIVITLISFVVLMN